MSSEVAFFLCLLCFARCLCARDSNRLTSLPESIGDLKNLNTLRVYNNNLTSLPESIVKLENLKIPFMHGITR